MNFRILEKFVVLAIVAFFTASCGDNKNTPTADSVEVAVADTIEVTIPIEKPIIDCNYTFDEAVANSAASKEIIQQQTLLTVQYYSIDGKLHQGQILVNKSIANEITEIFELIKNEHFPVAQVIPIVKYDWNDSLSMAQNNTYSFCYRNVNYSLHARGLAIDINPFYNPIIYKNSSRKSWPVGAVYNPEQNGTFTDKSPIVKAFAKFGFKWGKNMSQKSDYHHFEKRGANPVTLPKKEYHAPVLKNDDIEYPEFRL